MDRKHRKLNEGLDPERFCIKLKSDYRLILDDYRDAAGKERQNEPDQQKVRGTEDVLRQYRLRAYLRDLDLHMDGLPGHQVCLTGRYAIEHARRVHAKIRRQLLRFDNVTAVDVGFAVQEREKRFINCLAIRIHVGIKHSTSYLKHHRLPDPTNPRYFAAAKALREPQGVNASEPSKQTTYPRYPIGGVMLDDIGRHCCPSECVPYYCCPSVPSKPSHSGKAATTPKRRTDAQVIKNRNAEQVCPTCHRPCHCHCECCHCCCLCCRCDRAEACGDCWPSDCRLSICGVPLDVIEANYFPSTRHPGGDYDEGVFVEALKTSRYLDDKELLLTGRGKVSPLVGGISVGSVNGQAGTLAAVVWDETDGSPCALGNWHVLAGSATAQAGQPCYQPALFDEGGRDDVIGHLKRWHLGELGDAALAELDGSREFASGEILGLWNPISGYRSPELNLEIRKWGRTTGFTKGFIDGIDLATDVDYGDGFVRHFERQFHIAPLVSGRDVSQVGDSGSLVVTTCDLDDLEVIATGLLRKEPDFRIELRKCLSGDDFKEVEELASKIGRLLEQHQVQGPKKACGGASFLAFPKVENSLLAPALKLCREETPDGGEKVKARQLASDFRNLVACILDRYGIEIDDFLSRKHDKKNRKARNVYYAVGMIFAGDTPGSPFGEFALASDISLLAEDMRFSLRPVFEPRSSFRKLRSRPQGRDVRPGRRGIPREPGDQGADPRGQGPQPDGETLQSTGPGSGGGGG